MEQGTGHLSDGWHQHAGATTVRLDEKCRDQCHNQWFGELVIAVRWMHFATRWCYMLGRAVSTQRGRRGLTCVCRDLQGRFETASYVPRAHTCAAGCLCEDTGCCNQQLCGCC